AFYRSLVDYNRAIMRLHFRKGSLLEYNGVYLAEGPWPGKAQFDALRRARERDAGTYVDYGFTRPNVISRGPHAQCYECETNDRAPTPVYDGPILEKGQPGDTPAEELIPTPATTNSDSASQENPTEGVDLVRLPVHENQRALAWPQAYPSTSANPIQRTSHETPATTEINKASPPPAPLSDNPYRSAKHDGEDANMHPLATPNSSTNPLRPQYLSNQLPVTAIDYETVDESHPHYSPVEAAADPAVGQGAER
ncbi:MAG: hypothetical protein MI725_13590, partial [Pirellulales bacterium]|nr:hypothetical protein [Pirellulales bacterium]